MTDCRTIVLFRKDTTHRRYEIMNNFRMEVFCGYEIASLLGPAQHYVTVSDKQGATVWEGWSIGEARTWILSQLPPEVTILGLTFRRMEERDYEGFAGAGPGSYTNQDHGSVLIWDPSEEVLSEFSGEQSQRNWTYETILTDEDC